jgi:hypothetical protein
VLHLQRIKEDLERKELAECTFRPAINAKSQDLMRGRVAGRCRLTLSNPR